MSRSRGLLLVAMAVLLGGMVGCNTVSKAEYDALQGRYNDLSGEYGDLTLQLEDAKATESRLLAEVAQAKQRVTVAETEATRLRNSQARGVQSPPRPQAPPPIREGVEISLGSDELFAAGKASLSLAGKRRVADTAAKIRQQHAGAKILVYGHTSSSPISASTWTDNLELSAHRAMAVARELIKAGISAKKMETIAMGATQPVASNSTESGRARNRRVVIKVVR